MKKLRFIPIYFLFIITVFSSCKQTDGELLKEIQKSGIDLPVGAKMTVSDKVVYLDGIVTSDSISRVIENKLKGLPEVISVQNNLQIVAELEVDRARGMLDDNLLQSRITSALLADGLSRVKVDVMNGKVKIRGSVSSVDSLQVLDIVNNFATPDSVVDHMIVTDREMI